MDLFVGLPVSDLAVAEEWYTRFLEAEPSMRPNDTELVWGVVEHGHLYVEVRRERAGSGFVTVFVDDLAPRLDRLAEVGLVPERTEVYEADGVTKTLFADPDGNEIGLGGLTSP